MTPWKRGLLKAWLALSLLWALAATILAIRLMAELFDGWDGLLLAVGLLFVFLPMAALPPMALLGAGIVAIWIVQKFRAR